MFVMSVPRCDLFSQATAAPLPPLSSPSVLCSALAHLGRYDSIHNQCSCPAGVRVFVKVEGKLRAQAHGWASICMSAAPWGVLACAASRYVTAAGDNTDIDKHARLLMLFLRVCACAAADARCGGGG
jgi:hypothetical protein